MLALVIIFWLSVFGYVPYHFRNCEPVRAFAAGFSEVWLTVVHAGDFDCDHELDNTEAYDRGLLAGCISILGITLLMLAIAGYTIYLAS